MGVAGRIPISYSDDEVKIFHPLVEKSLKQYLSTKGLDRTYAILHHPPGVTGSIPDFVITEKSSGKWIFVIEVKRTPSSVKSIRTWDQARNYIWNNRSLHWASSSRPYFLVTNMELSYFLCDKADASAQFCVLKNGEVGCRQFGNDATGTLTDFSNNVIPRIFDLISTQQVEYSEHLGVILEKFVGAQEELTSHVAKKIEAYIRKNPSQFGFKNSREFDRHMEEWKRLNDPRSTRISYEKIAREISRDSLFRIFLYEYCREYFGLLKIKTPQILKAIQTGKKATLERSIKLSLDDLARIDFSQIIRNRLINFIPENMDDKSYDIFDKFLTLLHNELSDAIKENGSPNYLFNLITNNDTLYPWKEVNGDGKVMTDAELSDFVSELCFKFRRSKNIPHVFDPGCGTGNLIGSAYDKIKSLDPKLAHNKILSYLHGCEVDAFLGKLAVFGLTMRSPKEITKDTKIDIALSDFFEIPTNRLHKLDLVIMNPPFLRNDNKVLPLQRKIIEEKLSRVIGRKSVMVSASQPNFMFYFIELASELLKENGIAGYFIMKSVLNTQNGEHLKKFLLDNFDIKYIISVPRKFFKGYLVSPCIVIAERKKQPEIGNIVKFASIMDLAFFTTGLDELKEENDFQNSKLRLKIIRQSNLKPEDDWKKLLLPIPNFFDIFKTSRTFASLGELFVNIQRGGLASEGNGRGFFFPWSTGKIESEIGQPIINNIEDQFMNKGLNNADEPENYILDDDDLEKQECLAIPTATPINNFRGLRTFLNNFNRKFKRPKRWHIDGFPSRAQLIIPRASRETHTIFSNPYWDREDVYFSSNFFCLWDCRESIPGLNNDEILKYSAAFLNSSFGQMMFEIGSQDREGLRKIEGKSIKKNILLPIKGIQSHIQIVKEIIAKFDVLPFGLTGDEDTIPTPRYDMDLAFSKLLLEIEPELKKLYDSPEKLAEDAEYSLRELVRDRKEI